jgi:hypothetical protein
VSRIVCHFSCGAASAVATKLAIAKYAGTREVVIVNAFLKEEHADNRRFLIDCERWFGLPIVVLRDEKYGVSTHEVFRRERYMSGQNGASCSGRLKRKVLDAFSRPGDAHVLGFTIEEMDRLYDFRERHRETEWLAPLIDAELGKEDCKEMVLRAGIELPMMYRLGYQNANCIGCVKGGMGYWRAIREDFPEQFAQLADIQEAIGPGAYLHFNRKTGERYSLRNLPSGPVSRNEEMPSCSFYCAAAENLYLKGAA